MSLSFCTSETALIAVPLRKSISVNSFSGSFRTVPILISALETSTRSISSLFLAVSRAVMYAATRPQPIATIISMRDLDFMVPTSGV